MMASFDLHLGDCLEYMKSLPDGAVDAVVTDPPYGMSWNTDTTRFSGGNTKRGTKTNCLGDVAGDDKPFDPTPLLGFPNVVLWGSNHFAHLLPRGTTLVWVKRNDAAFGTFLSDAEVAWMKGGYGVYCFRKVFSPPSRMAETGTDLVQHPTQKPVTLMAWCMDKAGIPQAATVFDPYMGSGTTGVACMQTGRNFIGCEIDEKYFVIAKRRIEDAAAQLHLFEGQSL